MQCLASLAPISSWSFRQHYVMETLLSVVLGLNIFSFLKYKALTAEQKDTSP